MQDYTQPGRTDQRCVRIGAIKVSEILRVWTEVSHMAELLRIFVSATADLEAQRGVIGRTLAGLPVKVGAEIRRFPPAGVSYETLFELISHVDRVYFLLGQDITAPSGSEWDLAWQLERPVVALRTTRRLTPAALQFLRLTALHVPAQDWRSFASDAELARLVGLDLIDTLLHFANRYGLSVDEVVSLQRHRQRLQSPAGTSPGEADGTEAGAIILGQEAVM